MRVFDGIEDFATATGEDLGASGWVTIDQDRIDKFADATGDHQWIHVDREAASSGPFGGTIAHGFLTLSLLPQMWHEIFEVRGIKTAVNYGLGRVRFVSPVPSAARVRARVTILDVTTLDGAVQGTLSTAIEIEGFEKPAAVVESIVRYVA
ncbi:MaoC family dehydratase [Gordonia bronchialis]|uniref:MaoC family dehydratase n=1 Tax=Gordonia bronchialis TaxID=2054 RepID=UPI001CBB7339|nr:MaoC family dehydratase [Gordonia bronchialis]UAK39387.1 MaoC family dehydratase [Gordonia bronchialis]